MLHFLEINPIAIAVHPSPIILTFTEALSKMYLLLNSLFLKEI